MKIIGIMFAVLAALGIVHEVSVFSSKNNPPVSCQILGGEWNPLTGWRCGVAPAGGSSQTASPTQDPSTPSTPSMPSAPEGTYSQQCVEEYGSGYPYLVGDHCEASP